MSELEERKMVAEWMGWEYKDGPQCSVFSYLKNGRIVIIESHEFKPQNGGKDLSEVLVELDSRKRVALKKYICRNILRYTDNLKFNYGIWFQNPDNAPTIWKAICEIVLSELKAEHDINQSEDVG